jgi:hypothetical protein
MNHPYDFSPGQINQNANTSKWGYRDKWSYYLIKLTSNTLEKQGKLSEQGKMP